MPMCCRPVDISTKDREISARLELAKERAPQHSMSRTNSRQPTERGPSQQTSPSTAPASGPAPSLTTSTVRPSVSFANAAGAKTTVEGMDDQKATKEDTTSAVHDVADQEMDEM